VDVGLSPNEGLDCSHQRICLLQGVPALLQRAMDFATMVQRLYYHGVAALIQVAGDLATKGGWFCSKGRPTLLPWHIGLATWILRVATHGKVA
jgi:hypothetical protein